MKPAEFLPEAELEILDATNWYRERSEAVAARFLDEIAAAVDRLTEFPRSYPVIANTGSGNPIRRVRLLKFPFAVVYLELDAWFSVLAIPHVRRRPLYWLSRADAEP